MRPDAQPLEPERGRLRATIALATVLLVACGLPALLHLPSRAAAATTLAVLAVAVAARAARPAAAATPDCETLLHAIADTLPEGVVVVVGDRIASANPAAMRLLGPTAGPGAPAPTLFGDADVATAALTRGHALDREALLRGAGGAMFPARVSARDIDHDGLDARLLLLVDLSEDRALAARLDAQRAELETLARRLLTVQEDERASISRELHDDIGQAITAIKLSATSLAHEPDPPRTAIVRDTAAEIGLIADQTVAKLRDLSLLLRPPQLDALGLEAALRWQAGTLFRSDYPRLELDIPPLDCRPPRDVELACFRIAQEALTNVLRHARAGRVRLQLRCDDVALQLRIEDDGRGIEATATPGLGRITMRERARQLGGTLDVDSRPGRTCIEVVLPLAPGDAPRDGVPRG